MVLISKREAINRRVLKTKSILGPLMTGVAFLLAGISIVFIDPVQIIVNYKLRLTKGSTFFELLQHEIVGARISLYLFNITNAERFLAGDDEKIKLEEVGPFVFQEYRWYEDLEISEDGKQMSMTPRTRNEFIPERSIAHPKDVNLTLLNLPMLGATNLLSEYPSFLQYTFNVMAEQLGSKPIFNIDVHTYLWGYDNPLITLVHSLTPGLVYFKKIGILDRLYDAESEYRIVAGATDKDRFRIKSVKKIRRLEIGTTEDVDESVLTFETDTYEGIGYPKRLSPDTPINLYRIGICKTFKLEYLGRKPMEYGGEGLRYTLSNDTFKSDANSSKKYPDGLMDISSCFYGVPFMVSKGHFLDADPKILERIEGLKPDRNVNVNEVLVDRMVSVPFQTNFSIQLNIALGDVSYNRHTKRLANTVLPITHIKVDQPKMPQAIMNKFYLAFQLGPKLELAIFIVLTLTSIVLIGHAMRLIWYKLKTDAKGMDFEMNIDKKLLQTEIIERS
ncbi:unnamed protein product [Chrysodeixis includens]|uniref:Scavenger receptor class B member 1-like n=1 Tax=Chrysodeixis includens TaxID=689277 RepID=A0A9P0BMI7_CHRIL|nr:unnamed protein product [Chrysodeixis includens]